MSKTLTFRGQILHDQQDEIYLRTIKGKTGYRIKTFELISSAPGISTSESTIKIYKKKQTSIDALINFDDSTLLAAGYYQAEPSSYSDYKQVIFDNEVFNQNIFITHAEVRNSEPMNYYIEIETITLTDIQATQLTLKNLRTIASR